MPFTATARGFGSCGTISFHWDDAQPLGTADSGATDPATNSVAANLAVPDDASTGTHKVIASCVGGENTAWFTVVATEKKPTLTLAPEKGNPGTTVTATITDYGGCHDNQPRVAFIPAISLQWDEKSLTPSSSSTVNGDKDLDLSFPVPADVSPGEHTVVAVCGNARLPATFTVVAPENSTLTLAPAKGDPGTSFTATAADFGACRTVSFQWDDTPLGPGNDGLVGNFVVPNDASTGEHKVTATCGGLEAPATFTVVAAPKPTLTLNTAKGARGSQLMASGTGFACGDDSVELLWDGEVLGKAQAGTFTVPLTVPSEAPIGGHTVVATCRNHPDTADIQSFTVTSEPTSVIGPAALTLQPTSGHPGDRVRVTGDRFSCANRSRTVELSWDDGTPLPSASLDSSGHFDTSVSAPANTDVRRLTLGAACSDGSVVLAADFTFQVSPPPPPLSPPPPPPSPPPPPAIAGWLIALVLGIVGVLVWRYIRRRPKPPKTPAAHVQAVPRPGGPPFVTVRETPVNGEGTHAIRLEAHFDHGTQTIREVNDDRTRP